MEHAIVVRHAESEFSARRLASGDPSRPGGGLTQAGREQARALGLRLAGEAIDLCVTSEFRRTAETADVALQGRDVPRLVLAELNDIRVGDYEGRTVDEYRSWVRAHGPGDACPGGGESRAAVAKRYARGFRLLLARPESSILVVTHSLPIRYALLAVEDRDPTAVVDLVDYVVPHRLDRAEVERVAARLEAWCASPVFA
jgi:broad specificity phosphatase PhoE